MIKQREIKFRAWDKKENLMLYPEKHTRDKSGSFFLSVTDGSLCVMQFTGLLDKNGKDVYEDDLVRNKSNTDVNGKKYYSVYKVCFGFCGIDTCEGSWSSNGWYLETLGLNRGGVFEKWGREQTGTKEIEQMEVISNIYEMEGVIKN